MNLGEMKAKIYSMIEEYSEDAENLTEDEDLALKMNSIINQIQNEICRIKKLPAYTTKNVEEGQELTFTEIADNVYQINIVKGVDTDTLDDRIICNETGTARIYYYKYPEQIDMETDDEFEMKLPIDVLEVIPYGVAGDLLKSDVSSQYGTIYSARYREMLQQLDPRYNSNSVYIDGGVTV
jgi:hypothetical protein